MAAIEWNSRPRIKRLDGDGPEVRMVAYCNFAVVEKREGAFCTAMPEGVTVRASFAAEPSMPEVVAVMSKLTEAVAEHVASKCGAVG